MDEHSEGFNQETCAFNLDGSNRKEDQVDKEYAQPPEYMGTLDESDWSLGGLRMTTNMTQRSLDHWLNVMEVLMQTYIS